MVEEVHVCRRSEEVHARSVEDIYVTRTHRANPSRDDGLDALGHGPEMNRDMRSVGNQVAPLQTVYISQKKIEYSEL